jgi:hypothetical protein
LIFDAVVVRSHRQAAAVFIWLGAGCGPSGVVTGETEQGTSEQDTSEQDTSEQGTSEQGTSESSSETGELPEFPELPESEPGCLERGGVHALAGEPHPIVWDQPDHVAPEDLVATSEGLLAFFRMSPLDDPSADENAWVAPLDEHGIPISEPFVMFERGVDRGPRAHAAADGSLLVTFAGQWDSDGRAGAVAIDALGMPLAAEQPRQPNDRHCCVVGDSPEGTWTGYRHLFGWRDNSSGPLWGHELLLEVFASDGSSSGWVQLQDDGAFSPEPRFVVTSEAAFMISAAGEGDEPIGDGVMLHRFDVAGTWLPDQAITLDLPEDFVWVGGAALAANADGFVIWLEERNDFHRSLRWHFDPQGQLLAGPIVVTRPDPDTYDSEFELVARPGGFALAATRGNTDQASIVVVMLDSTGAPMDTIEIQPGPDESLRSPNLAQRGDSTFVFYEVDYLELDHPYATHRLFVHEIGCVE